MPSSVSVGELNLEVTANIDPLIRGMEAGEASMTRFRRDAQRLIQEAMTPQERHYQRLTEVQVLHNRGLLTTIQAIRAQQMSMRQLNAATGQAANGVVGGANRMGFAIGQALTGVEDFVTVVGTTGLAGGLRAASNNFAQAGRIIAGEFAGPLIGVGTIIAAVAIPALIKYVSNTEDAAERTKRWVMELDNLDRALKEVNRQLDMKQSLEKQAVSIDRTSTSESGALSLKDTELDLQQTRELLQAQEKQLESFSNTTLRKVFTDDLNESIRQSLLSVKDEYGPELSKALSEALTKGKNEFTDGLSRGEDASILVENLESSLRQRLSRQFPFLQEEGGLSFLGDLSENVAALQENESLLGRITSRSQDMSDAIKELTKDEQMAVEKILGLQKKVVELKDKERAADIAQNEMSIKQEMARAKELSMLEGMNEAERSLFELQKQRVMLLEKGAELGAQGLEDARALSDAFLNARATNLQAQLDDVKNEVSAFSTGTAGSAGAARAAAIRNIAQQAGRVDKDDTEQRRRIIDELKGIKRILDGQNPVELSPVL